MRGDAFGDQRTASSCSVRMPSAMASLRISSCGGPVDDQLRIASVIRIIS